MKVEDYNSEIFKTLAEISKRFVTTNFDKYIEKLLKGFVYRNILRGDKIYAFKQMFEYRLSFKYKIIFIMLGLLPVFSYKFLQNIRNSLKKNY